MPEFIDWKKYDQILHVTWSYYPEAILMLCKMLTPEALNIVKNTTLSQIINLGLLKQRNISYIKLTNEYQLTKDMMYHYKIWTNDKFRPSLGIPKRTSLIISIENQKMFKLLRKQTKLTQPMILNEIIYLGIIEKLRKENIELDLKEVINRLSLKEIKK